MIHVYTLHVRTASLYKCPPLVFGPWIWSAHGHLFGTLRYLLMSQPQDNKYAFYIRSPFQASNTWTCGSEQLWWKVCDSNFHGKWMQLSYNGPFIITSFWGALNGENTWKRMLSCNLVTWKHENMMFHVNILFNAYLFPHDMIMVNGPLRP